MKALVLVVVLTLSAFPAFAGSFMRVQAWRSGTIVVDGHTSSLEQLKSDVRGVDVKQSGVLLFLEDNGKDAWTDSQSAVLNAVMSANVPLILCGKPDFSDAAMLHR